MFANWYDSHIHSHNSRDGRDRVTVICETAFQRGIKGITITDHCNTYYGRKTCLALKRKLLADIRDARRTFGERLTISAGLELGEPHHDLSLAEELTSDPEIDFVIGSLHRLRGEEDFYEMQLNLFEAAELDVLLRKYYEELDELVACSFFDVLGHINYQVRYMSASARGRIDLTTYYDRLSAILKNAAQSGKGIEINTSGLRRELGEILPSSDVVRMFGDAGGEIVTLGSDAHDAASVGAGIFTAMEKLKEAGFPNFAYFKKRKASFIPIA